MDMIANRYRVVSRIGRGAFKQVYKAVDTRDGTDVAVAVMPSISRHDFEHEVALARRVVAPHVVKILDASVDDDETGYLVMEYCDGENLADLVNRGPLTIERAAPIMLAFARALRAIHEAHVLHRDVKLENVIVSTSGGEQKLWVIDFGLSARSSTSSTAVHDIRGLAGTLPYMAPEVVSGRNLDARSDVYAFGVCCYRMLTGKLPIDLSQAQSDREAVELVRDTPGHDVSSVPALVRELVGKMISPVQADRPYMPDVLTSLERLLGTPPVVVGDPRPARSARPRPSPLGLSVRIRVRAVEPTCVVVAPCAYAPIVTIEPGERTRIHALTGDGAYRWGAELDGRYTTGLRADLDGDGVRELYVAGPNRIAAIDARGCIRYQRALIQPEDPTLLAVGSILVVDGATIEPTTGATTGRLPYAYEGDGNELVVARDCRGIAYNGRAHQAFRGDHGTAAAIISTPSAREFLVAQLEATRSSARVQLSVYGPGGARKHRFHVAACELDTGDLDAVDRALSRNTPLFGPAQAPVAVMAADGTASVIVPLVGADGTLPPTLVAFGGEPWRELWRTRVDGARPGAALGDIDGDGRIEVVIAGGESMRVFDAWTGAEAASIPSSGVPIAIGDPASTGYRHVFAVGDDAIEIWRGPECLPGAMQWCGPRGDSWRTGTLRADGQTLGPI